MRTECNSALSIARMFLTYPSDRVFDDVNTYDKTLIEKLQHLDSLNEDEKKSIYTLIDSLITKKKLKDNLQSLANL
jgi:hypothetical protein